MNKRQKTNLYFLIPFLIFAIFYIRWATIRGNRDGVQHFKQFNSVSIKGKVIKVGSAARGYAFKVNNDTTRFFFYPSTSRFKHTQVGDSICKPAYSDTLWVKNKGEWHPYTFLKYEE